MAVYKANYGRYKGALTPSWSRFMILPRYAWKDVFESRLFVVFFAFCFFVPFAGVLAVYLKHNLAALQFPWLQQIASNLPIDATFFRKGIVFQSWLCFLMALAVGPSLIAPDLRNNGLPLYLSRPFSRAEYVLGKLTVLVALMSLITWVPGLFLFFFQVSLEGTGWLRDHLNLGVALFVGSWVWILVVSLVALAVSAWVRWRPVARISLLVVFFVFWGFGTALNERLGTWWGWLVSLPPTMSHLWSYLFGQELDEVHIPPVWSTWLTLAAACGISLWLLSRRIRAYEVVQ